MFPPPCLNHNSSGGYTMAGNSPIAYNQITATEQVQIQVILNNKKQALSRVLLEIPLVSTQIHKPLLQRRA